MRTLQPRHWARQEIASLDAEADHERISHLSAEVRFGNTLVTGALYTVTFARQMAVPSIAAVVHRGGRSPIMQTTRKRNDDTLVMFGEFFSHGHSSERGRAAIDRLNEIHSAYPITNEDSLYTIGTIIFEAERTPQHLGVEPLTTKEKHASFHFWRGIGERMHLTGMPETYERYLRFTEDYEARHWAYTPSGRAVTDAVIEDYAARLLPARLRPLGARATAALLAPELLAVHQLPEPGPMLRRSVRLGAQGVFGALAVLPDPPERSIVPRFGAEYGGCPHLADVGPQHGAGTAARRG